MVLYLGRVNGNISADTEQSMFGMNIILVLVMQEKDAVRGEIFYSLIPIILNNGYVIYSNFTSLR